MKALSKVFFLSLIAIMLIACSESTDFSGGLFDEGPEIVDSPVATDQIQPVTITVPFKVKYTGRYIFQGLNPDRCDVVNVVVDGVGTGTHVGNSTVHFDFCGLPQPDGSFVYGDPFPVDAFIVAANGDSLFLTMSGTVIPGRTDDHPEFVTSYWQDPFFIIGGTGRFKDATGGGMSDDYNSSEDPFSHHDWDGTITMKKGKPN